MPRGSRCCPSSSSTGPPCGARPVECRVAWRVTFTVDGEFVWDFWTAYDEAGGRHHLFYLHAPASLGDPELRHRNARVGHAVSEDLRRLDRPARPAPRAGARRPSTTWPRGPAAPFAVTTPGGCSRPASPAPTTGGSSASAPPRSEDLVTWERTDLLLERGPRGTTSSPARTGSRRPGATRGWCAATTAAGTCTSRPATPPACRAAGSSATRSPTTWRSWQVLPPLSAPTGRFEWMEVIQVVRVEGRWVLLFSCLADQMPGAPAGSGGVWSVPVDGPGSPVDIAAATRLTDETLYVGKVVARSRGGVLHGVPQPGAGRRLRRGADRPGPGDLARGRREALLWSRRPTDRSVTRVTS